MDKRFPRLQESGKDVLDALQPENVQNMSTAPTPTSSDTCISVDAFRFCNAGDPVPIPPQYTRHWYMESIPTEQIHWKRISDETMQDPINSAVLENMGNYGLVLGQWISPLHHVSEKFVEGVASHALVDVDSIEDAAVFADPLLPASVHASEWLYRIRATVMKAAEEKITYEIPSFFGSGILDASSCIGYYTPLCRDDLPALIHDQLVSSFLRSLDPRFMMRTIAALVIPGGLSQTCWNVAKARDCSCHHSIVMASLSSTAVPFDSGLCAVRVRSNDALTTTYGPHLSRGLSPVEEQPVVDTYMRHWGAKEYTVNLRDGEFLVIDTDEYSWQASANHRSPKSPATFLEFTICSCRSQTCTKPLFQHVYPLDYFLHHQLHFIHSKPSVVPNLSENGSTLLPIPVLSNLPMSFEEEPSTYQVPREISFEDYPANARTGTQFFKKIEGSTIELFVRIMKEERLWLERVGYGQIVDLRQQNPLHFSFPFIGVCFEYLRHNAGSIPYPIQNITDSTGFPVRTLADCVIAEEVYIWHSAYTQPYVYPYTPIDQDMQAMDEALQNYHRRKTAMQAQNSSNVDSGSAQTQFLDSRTEATPDLSTHLSRARKRPSPYNPSFSQIKRQKR